MRRRHLFFLTPCFAGTLLMGCSTAKTQTETQLDRRVQEEPHANSPEEIANRAAKAFAEAPGLTPDQKGRLSAIYLAVYAEAMAIRTQIGKNKSLLFKLAASDDAQARKDLLQLKKKIVALDQERLNLMFKALQDVQAIVGQGKDKEELYRHFRRHENPFEGIVAKGKTQDSAQ